MQEFCVAGKLCCNFPANALQSLKRMPVAWLLFFPDNLLDGLGDFVTNEAVYDLYSVQYDPVCVLHTV